MTKVSPAKPSRQDESWSGRISTLAELQFCTGALIDIEPRFGTVLARHGFPAMRSTEASLETLLQIVTEQFLSLKAAARIWSRIEEKLRPFDPDQLLRHAEEELMGLGLSRAKARSFHGLARAVRDRTLILEELHRLPGEDAHRILCGLPGIGPWSAAIFRLGALGDGDAWPAGDLALQVAAQNLFGMPTKPNQREMIALAESWRPFRSAAARLLWAYYRELKGLDQATDSSSQN